MSSDDTEGEPEERTLYCSDYQDVEGFEENTPAPVLNATAVLAHTSSGLMQLGELNRRKSESFYPIFIFLGCIVVLGVLTNVLVCYIYRCRARRATSNFLVIFFAVCDLAGCLFAVPLVLSTLALPYRYNVAFLCKLYGYVETCCVCSLCMTLLCAAYICYWQLCRSGSGVCRARYCCFGALAVSVVLSIPAMVVHSVNPVQTSVPGVVGRTCGLDVELQQWLVHLHHAMILGCVTVVFAGMGLLYGLIFIGWLKQRQAQCRGDRTSPAVKQFPKKHRFVREDTSSSSVTAGSYSEEIGRLHTARTQCHTSAPHHHSLHHHIHHHHHHFYHHNQHHHHTDPARVPLRGGYDGGGGLRTTGTYDRAGGRGIVKSISHGMMRSSSSQHTNLLDSCSSTVPITSTAPTVSPVVQLHVKNTKQASIFLVISIVFVVCMLPYVVVTVLIATTNVFQRFSSTSTEIIVRLCLHSYLLNYLAKPVVYIIFNINFREEVKQFFLKLWELCPRKKQTQRPSPPQSETTGCSTPRAQHREMRSLSNSSIYRPAKTSV